MINREFIRKNRRISKGTETSLNLTKENGMDLQKEIFVMAAFTIAEQVGKQKDSEFVEKLTDAMKRFADDYINV